MNLRICFSLCLTAALFASGCRRETIRVYTAPKDQTPPMPVAADESATAANPPPERPQPKIEWTLPSGWEQMPAGQMSAAQFSVKTDGGEAAVNITPLPNLAGKEAMIVNMWRQQVGQPPMGEGELATALTPVPVSDGQGQLFEIAGTREGEPTKIVTAMLHRPDGSWFFKLSGSEAAVAAQKPAFLEFLKSVRMGAPVETATAKDSQP